MNTITEEQAKAAELASVTILVQGEHIVDRIVESGKIHDDDLNCLAPYYEAKGLLPQGVDPETWIVKRVSELQGAIEVK